MEQTPKPPVMKEQLKQAIEDFIPDKDENGNIFNSSPYIKAIVLGALDQPSILRHADPEIMRQAGWVREEEWISVEDRLPERNKNVLLKRAKPFHVYLVTGFQRDGVFYSNESANNFDKVTHWKPLPNPPKQ